MPQLNASKNEIVDTALWRDDVSLAPLSSLLLSASGRPLLETLITSGTTDRD